jgi:hypothetical protein
MVKFLPLRGTGLIVLDPKFVFAAVDNFFGGIGRFRQDRRPRVHRHRATHHPHGAQARVLGPQGSVVARRAPRHRIPELRGQPALRERS